VTVAPYQWKIKQVLIFGGDKWDRPAGFRPRRFSPRVVAGAGFQQDGATHEGEFSMSAAVQMPTRRNMTDSEWQARCDLAALYRICDYFNWTDTINTHMSVRIPGEPNHFLINRYGEMFDEVTASSLLKMDLDGNVLGEEGRFNNAGFIIHSGVYKARPDANCVLHTHTRAGAGISLLENGIRPISQDALHVYDDLAYHAYGVPATQEECDALGRTCADGSCVVLLNHGLLTLGETTHGALMRLYMLERACEVELMARTMNAPIAKIDDYVIGKAAERMKKIRSADTYGLMEWKALVRTVERKGTDFRS
jgi:ribulose-5-phosphate 4-epimerase/fuculose-1-phosphate aldolase